MLIPTDSTPYQVAKYYKEQLAVWKCYGPARIIEVLQQEYLEAYNLCSEEEKLLLELEE